MVHRNARLTPAGRGILVQRVLDGRPVAHVAKEMGVSRTCAHRWFRRYLEHGWAGMGRDGGQIVPPAFLPARRPRSEDRRGPRGAGEAP